MSREPRPGHGNLFFKKDEMTILSGTCACVGFWPHVQFCESSWLWPVTGFGSWARRPAPRPAQGLAHGLGSQISPEGSLACVDFNGQELIPF